MNKIIIILGIFVFVWLYGCQPKADKPSNTETKKSISLQDSLANFEINQTRLSAELLWKFGRVGGYVLSPDGKQVAYTITRYNAKTNKSYTDIFVQPVEGGEKKQITDFVGPEFNVRFYPDGSKIGFIATESGEPQLWEMNTDGSNKKQISTIKGGITSFEYAPDGNHIYYTADVKLTKTVNDVHTDLPLAEAMVYDDLMYRHWDNWDDNHYSHIFVASYQDGSIGEATDIMAGELWDSPLSPYFDYGEITWRNDGMAIAYTCKKLSGKDYAVSTNSDIYIYDLKTGETKNITEGMMGYDRNPRFSPNNKLIAWESMETPGYESDKNRLMVYNFETNEKHYITKDFDQNANHLTWTDDNTIYFISGIHATHQIYKASLADNNITKITDGIHDFRSIDIKENTMIAGKMTMSMAYEIFNVNMETGKDQPLSEVNKAIYEKIEMGRVEKRWIKTFDNKDMLVWVIYPPEFDSTKTYPALLYCQGGPQSAVSQFFSFRWNFQMMAAHDYIIVAPNRRGLPSFGQEWNAQISQDYGGKNMQDYLTAIDEISKEPYIDQNRLGAVGASYGGFSVYYLAGHHEKRFKAFIAHCGMFNLESQYAATEEFFFVNHDLGGAYWEEPKPNSYKFSPHLFVDKWDTPIMAITGGRDFRIPYTESLQAFNAARLKGIPARLLFFPDETHFVLKPQNSILWQREFFKWLDKWLK